jgi:hypothetical protein
MIEDRISSLLRLHLTLLRIAERDRQPSGSSRPIGSAGTALFVALQQKGALWHSLGELLRASAADDRCL